MNPLLYRKSFRRTFFAGMLISAAVLRAVCLPQQTQAAYRKVRTAAEKLPAAEAVLFLEAGLRLPDKPAEETAASAQTVTEESALPTQTEAVTEPQTEPPVETQTEPAAIQLSFSPQEADAIPFRGNCTYTVDKQSLLTAPLSWKTPVQGPQVLIVHSHTSECYSPSEGWEYEASGDYRTLDQTRNVIAVGDVLTESLEALGISVIHDTTCHDYPSYNSSYANSRQTIEKVLAEHPSVVTVIDIHRDAAEEVFRETAQIEGETAAKLMLVVGTDEGGLSHPFWRENLSFSLKLQALANRRYPGLFKSLALRSSRFNQDETPASVIVEVGSTGNSLPEALTAAKYLGEVLAELLYANR